MKPKNKKKKNNVYRVGWMGANPDFMYEKYFKDYNEAEEFSTGISDATLLKLNKEKEGGLKWRVALNSAGKEMIDHIKLKRKIKKKYSKAIGDDSEVVTTIEYSKNQKTRLANGLVVAPLLIYIGGKYALPSIFRIALVGVGAFVGYKNLSQYYINRKLHKDDTKK